MHHHTKSSVSVILPYNNQYACTGLTFISQLVDPLLWVVGSWLNGRCCQRAPLVGHEWHHANSCPASSQKVGVVPMCSGSGIRSTSTLFLRRSGDIIIACRLYWTKPREHKQNKRKSDSDIHLLPAFERAESKAFCFQAATSRQDFVLRWRRVGGGLQNDVESEF
jgi:hypothetical protein